MTNSTKSPLEEIVAVADALGSLTASEAAARIEICVVPIRRVGHQAKRAAFITIAAAALAAIHRLDRLQRRH